MNRHFSRSVWQAVAVVLLALYLPMFGASLVLVLILERLVLRRIPRLRDWLGLAAPREPALTELPASVPDAALVET